MNKELKDSAWACLPREFREEVKKMHQKYIEYRDECEANHRRNSANAMAKIICLNTLFGYHNLTSDAEGEDEMLHVSRKQIDALQGEIFKAIMDAHDADDWQDAAHYILDVMPRSFAALFGSKCLPDEVTDEDNFASKEPRIEDGEKESFTYPKFRIGDKVLFNNNICRIIGTDREDAEYQLERIIDNHLMGWAEENEISLYEEPKPAEPKFKKGDMVIYKRTGKKKVVLDIDKYGRYYVALPNMQSPMYIDESDLEPYTETEVVAKMRPIESKVSVYLATKEEDEEFRMLLHENGLNGVRELH